MSFNVGLSGLNAAQEEISITGNNIANASTTGFKSSRADFGDVYAASVLGGGANRTGGGVSLQDISQNLSQGNISFTDNTLDMAINGEGFFILKGEDGTAYTRAGAFGTDKEGNIVNNLGERLQGYAPTPAGEASGGGALGDLIVTTGEIQPRPTTLVTSEIRLDASATPSSIIGSNVVTNAGTSSDPRVGVSSARAAQIFGQIDLTADADFSAASSGFGISLDGTAMNIVLDGDYTNDAPAMQAAIQGQIDANGNLSGAIAATVSSAGNIELRATQPGNHNLVVEPDISAEPDVDDAFLPGAFFATRVAGTLDPATLDFTGAGGVAFDVTIGGNVVTINLDQDYSGAGGDPEAGLEALEDFIQGELETALPGKANVSVSAGGDFVFQIMDGSGDSLEVEPAALFATFTGSAVDNTGAEAVTNGYDAEVIQVLDSNGISRQISVPAGASANAVAQLFAAVPGVNASATSTAYITATNRGAPNDAGHLPLGFAINGRNFESAVANETDRLADLAGKINAAPGNLSAQVVEVEPGVSMLEVTENNGLDLVFTGGNNGKGSITVAGSTRDENGDYTVAAASEQQFADLGNLNDDAIVIGGIVDFTLDENVTMADALVDEAGMPITGSTESIFGNISSQNALVGESFELNTFDPDDPDTYYRSTALSVFDSLGNEHTLSQFFVKERPTDETQSGSTWTVYFQIDGENVGHDPLSADGEPVLASAQVRFDQNGLYDATQQPVHITNWTPLNAAGEPTGAGPEPGNIGLSDQITNSNFEVDLSGLTQFGGEFSVRSNTQDGYATGQLTGLDIDSRGLVFARFSNGQSEILGEVALADFANPTGLSNLGGTRFGETSESGPGTPSGAGTAGLGVIQSGALEDSNVELSEQLVQLIISQRNFQSSAQVIEATDAVTQTILNL